MRSLKLIVALLSSWSSLAHSQFSSPLRIKNAGVLLSPLRYNINYPTGGGITCVDNVATLSSQCTVNGVPAAAFPLLAPDGTAAAPSYSFASNTATGMFETAAGQLNFNSSIANGATPAFNINTTNAFSNNYLLNIQTGGFNAFRFYVSGGAASNEIAFNNSGNGVFLGGLITGNGGNSIDLDTFSSLRPSSAGGATLGNNTNPWGVLFTTAGINTGAGGATKVLVSATAPTISSGFGTGASITANNGTAAFRVGVGTTSATTGVIGLPAATTGWNCQCADITTNSATVFACKQTASATTTATIGNFNTSAAAAAWVDSDVLEVSCFAY